jgi:transposase-like protein
MKQNLPTEQTRDDGVAFPLKPYTISQLALLYGVTSPTLRKWLKPFTSKIGEKNGHFYTIAQVKTILTNLGIPGDMFIE